MVRSPNIEGSHVSIIFSIGRKGQRSIYKKSELPNLAATAESIAINILKLESASITAIKQSNILLKNYIKTQLSSRSKFEDLPKLIHNNNIGDSDHLVKKIILLKLKTVELFTMIDLRII